MTRSPGRRFFVVGALAALMLVPTFFVGAVIDDRAGYSRQTLRGVAEEWGGRQTIGAPRLVIPVTASVARNVTRSRADPATGAIRYFTETVEETEARPDIILYPERYEATLDLDTEIRARGVFEAPVYAAAVSAMIAFDPGRVRLEADETALWDKARFELTVSAAKGLRGATSLSMDGEAAPLEARRARRESVIFAEIGDPRDAARFDLRLALNGATGLYLSPAGRLTTVAMTADWPDPSFTGGFLPDGSAVREDGFAASWTIPHLATEW